MNYRIVEKDNKKYIQCASPETPIRTEQDALDLISACWENDTSQIMLHDEVLPDDFFQLRTGLLGKVLQKFVNYRIKIAVVISNGQRIKGRFKELLAESNKGNDFRVFKSTEEAENWLLG